MSEERLLPWVSRAPVTMTPPPRLRAVFKMGVVARASSAPQGEDLMRDGALGQFHRRLPTPAPTCTGSPLFVGLLYRHHTHGHSINTDQLHSWGPLSGSAS